MRWGRRRRLRCRSRDWYGQRCMLVRWHDGRHATPHRFGVRWWDSWGDWWEQVLRSDTDERTGR